MNRITVAWRVTLDMCQKSVKHDDMYGKWVLSTVAIIIFLLVKKRYPLPFGENYSLSFPVSPPFRVIFRIYFCSRHSGGWVNWIAHIIAGNQHTTKMTSSERIDSSSVASGRALRRRLWRHLHGNSPQSGRYLRRRVLIPSTEAFLIWGEWRAVEIFM